jgi:hypothetical protein
MDIYSLVNLDLENQDKTELLKIIKSILKTLDDKQLKLVIKELKKPFFINKLSGYLIDKNLPGMGTEEFDFLIIADKYKGNIIRKIVKEAGISDYYLKKFIKKYSLIEIDKGVYVFPNKKPDYLFFNKNIKKQ